MDYTVFNELVPDSSLIVAGVDEAGRGPLAGPVFAAAVILPHDLLIEGVTDSKKISEKNRREYIGTTASVEAMGYSLCKNCFQ